MRAVDDLLDAATTGIDDDPDAVALVLVHGREVDARIAHGFCAGAPSRGAMKRLIRRAILASMTVVGSKSSDFGCDPDLERRRVEPPDDPGARHSGDEVRPIGRKVVADRHDRAKPGDDGTAGRILFRQVGS